MDPTHFDALVQSLARFGSRRRLLTGLAGGLLAPLVAASTSEAKRRHSHRHPHAHAQKDDSASHGEGNGGNSACAHFCQALFAPGADRGQCVSEAAQGRGLCATCGDDVRAVCCAKTNGYCRSYATAGCCGGGCTPQCAGKACGDSDDCGGQCDGTCPSGQVCLSAACFATCPGAVTCLIGAGGCKPPASCMQTTGGVSVCLDLTTNVSCATNPDCAQRLGSGAVCVVNPPQPPPCEDSATPFCAICGVPGGCPSGSS